MLERQYLNLISGQSHGPVAVGLRGLLAVAEVPYRTLMRFRNARYDSNPVASIGLGRPTVSVGNLTAGGTGKTPVVQWLASELRSARHQPAVLMRGYRKAGAHVSDEQVMLQQLLPRVPIEANPDRIAGAAAILARYPQTTCFILDDGFQHRRAKRDFDLLLVHAGQPFGFNHVHPRGLLREPLTGLQRASAILMTHASEVPPDQLLQTQGIIRQYTAAPIFHCDHVNRELLSADGTEHRELSDLATRPFMLFTGIGQPQTLAASLRRFTSYKTDRFFNDHHHYTPSDLRCIIAAAREAGANTLVTTEKDWAKLHPLWLHTPDFPPLYRLALQVRFWENEQRPLTTCITNALRGKPD